MTTGLIAAVLEEAELKANDRGVTLQEYLGNRTIGDLVEQFTKDDNHQLLNANDFFIGDNGDFTTVREVSESSRERSWVSPSHLSSHVSAMDIDSIQTPENLNLGGAGLVFWHTSQSLTTLSYRR